MSAPLFDLVAVAYEAPNETRRFLETLVQVQVPFTFTIIDNNTPSGLTQDVIQDAMTEVEGLSNCLESRAIYNPDNLGYARACNWGASLGDAPYIGLLNCDIQMRPGVLSTIGDVFYTQTDVGIIGPRTTTSGGALTHAGIIPGPRGFQHRQWLKQDQGQCLEQMDVPTVSGATYFIRRSAWVEMTGCEIYREVAPDALGAFLPTQHYFEETFCSLHAREHGWRVVYEGGVTMIHEWNKSSPKSASKYWNDSKQYFLKACAAHGIEETGC